MKEKLKPKINSNSISNIAAVLRGESSPNNIGNDMKSDDPISDNVNDQTNVDPKATPERKVENTFSSILELIKEKDYDCKSTLYLDQEVKEVFQMLKSKGKIPIAGLVSYILEQWLIDHQDEIKELLSERKNRFI